MLVGERQRLLARVDTTESEGLGIVPPLHVCTWGCSPNRGADLVVWPYTFNAHIILGCGTKNEPNIYPTPWKSSARRAEWQDSRDFTKPESLLKSYLIWWFHLVFIIYNGWLGERRLDLEGRFYSSLWIERRQSSCLSKQPAVWNRFVFVDAK